MISTSIERPDRERNECPERGNYAGRDGALQPEWVPELEVEMADLDGV
jgi:hypothetical protein